MMRIVKALLGYNIVSLVHLLQMKPKQFLRACSSAYVASRKMPDAAFSAIPEISVGEILGDRKPVIRMPVMRYEDGMLPSDQAMVLLAILVAEAPKEVLEIGTFMGHTARLMAENLETATIHTADLPVSFSAESDPEQLIPKDDFHLISRRIVGREFKDQPCANRIVQHFADTATWDFQDT